MRITICDDDKLITFQLTEYLNEFFQNSGFEMPEVITYNCAEDLLADPARMDLVFLDIEMNSTSGLDIAHAATTCTTGIPKHIFL